MMHTFAVILVFKWLSRTKKSMAKDKHTKHAYTADHNKIIQLQMHESWMIEIPLIITT